jgi:hypothetical protein
MLLDAQTIDAYDSLMDLCFETSRGRGAFIKIKANVEMYKEVVPNWREEYTNMFVPAELRVRRQEFNLFYNRFISAYFMNVGISGRARIK